MLLSNTLKLITIEQEGIVQWGIKAHSIMNS